MSKDYATYEATVQCLESLGFKGTPEEDNKPALFFDSPKVDEHNMPVIQAFIYMCRNNGYWCVDLDWNFRAPCVWNDPSHIDNKTTENFVSWLDEKHPGWR